jgi:hypothetical protein
MMNYMPFSYNWEWLNIKQLNVEPFPIIRKWHIVHHAEAELSPIARRFKQYIIDNT